MIVIIITMYNLVIFLFLLILIAFIVIRICFYVITVHGNSMNPALVDGDRVIVFRRWPTLWLRKGQIAIWRFPDFIPGLDEKLDSERRTRTDFRDEKNNIKQVNGHLLIKRIVGLPNDRVSTDILDIQDNFRDEFIDLHDQNSNRNWLIPLGYCFIKGDSVGLDSTILGPVPLEDCIGIVVMKIQ